MAERPPAALRITNGAPQVSKPPANVVHIAFQLMVALGMAILALSGWAGWSRWRTGSFPTGKWFLRAVVLAGPAAVLAMEAGWTTTEVGRQPFIAQGLMLVEDAVTPRQGIVLLVLGLGGLYTGLAASAVVVLRSMSARWRRGEEPGTPYGPPHGEADAADETKTADETEAAVGTAT